MVIRKVLSNNTVTALDENGKEMVAIGKGIGFAKKPGDLLESTKVSRMFYSANSLQEKRMMEILQDIPYDCLQITESIIKYAESVLQKKLSPSLFITLGDHIHFAMERTKKNMLLGNPMGDEIRYIYPKEYAISKKALNYIKRKTDVQLPKEELILITLHFVNAQTEYNEIPDVMKLGKIIKEIVKIVERELEVILDESSITYSRFIAHLRYFLIRWLNQVTSMQEDVDELYQIVKIRYTKANHCVERIMEYMVEQYGITYNVAEEFYLTLHIERLNVQIEGE